MKKKDKIPFKNPYYITTIIFMPLMIYSILFLAIITVADQGTGTNLLSEAKFLITKADLNHLTEKAKNDDYTKYIVEQCQGIEQIKQPNCVIKTIRPNYNYTVRNKTRIQPSEYKEKGGSCTDTTIMHSAVFKTLGWKVQYIFPNKQHVYLIISKKIPCPENPEDKCNFFCDIDGDNDVCKISY